MEFNIKLSNRQILNGMIISPGEHTKAVIIMVHGLGEHIQRYVDWAGKFKNEGIAFIGLDLPGHGRSEGRRGNIRSYFLIDEMLDILLENCRKTFPGCPIYIYGHSLGGGIVIEYLLKRNPRIKGAIVTSPWLCLTFQPPKNKLILASIMKNLVPGLVQASGLVVDHISRDRAEVEKYIKDPFVHGKISVSLFASAMNAGKYSLEHASELKTPTLLMHGSDDKLTSPQASVEFAGKTDMVKLKIWKGGYHELHNELFREEVFKYIMNWINSN